MEIDHKIPLVPLDTAFDDMSLDDLVDRAWCELELLQPICKPCHRTKSKEENKERRRLKKLKQGGENK